MVSIIQPQFILVQVRKFKPLTIFTLLKKGRSHVQKANHDQVL